MNFGQPYVRRPVYSNKFNDLALLKWWQALCSKVYHTQTRKAIQMTTKLASYFEQRTRENGESHYCSGESMPGWLNEAIRDAHNGMMPHDWVYEIAQAVCRSYDDKELTSDEIGEFANDNVDVYTGQLAAWYGNFCNSNIFAYAEDSANGCSGGERQSIEEQLRAIQYFAIEYIAGTIFAAIEANQEA
jgi:hypothetical protein